MKTLQKTLIASVVGLSSLMGAASSMAQDSGVFLPTRTSATMQVNAVVNPVCSITATNVAFGTVALSASTSGTATATGTITSTCTKKTSYSVAIDGGRSGNIADRKMSGAANGNTDLLGYNLFLDSAFTKLWGDAEEAGEKMANIGTGTAQTATVYAKLPLNQFVQADSYGDTLTVTLTY
jgi:spore coat protein U-like protein